MTSSICCHTTGTSMPKIDCLTSKFSRSTLYFGGFYLRRLCKDSDMECEDDRSIESPTDSLEITFCFCSLHRAPDELPAVLSECVNSPQPLKVHANVVSIHTTASHCHASHFIFGTFIYSHEIRLN